MLGGHIDFKHQSGHSKVTWLIQAPANALLGLQKYKLNKSFETFANMWHTVLVLYLMTNCFVVFLSQN